MIDNKFKKWNSKTDHPKDRCEATVTQGQCPYTKAEGTNYCPMHGSNSGRIARQQETIRNYRLARWQQRINDFADNDQIKSLREEIGILRMMMEEMLIKCTDTTELMLYSHRISDLAMKIERLVVSCDKLENRMGMLLSKRAVLQLAGTYVNIINTYVSDPDVIEQISNEMLEATRVIDTLAIERVTLDG